MRIQKITNFLFTCAVVFGLGFFFPFQYLSIFLAVETTKCVVRLQNLESFPHISEVDGREEVPVRTGESFESGNATVVKIHQIVYVVFDGIWLVVVIPYKSAPQCVVYETLLSFKSKISLFIRDGSLFSGISIRHVQPATTAAREPVSKSSRYSNPGSFRCA